MNAPTAGTSGGAPLRPARLLSILVYSYVVGVFFSQKREIATYNSITFHFVAADEHPDHDTRNTFHKSFLKDVEMLIVQILMTTRTMSVLNLGNLLNDDQICSSISSC